MRKLLGIFCVLAAVAILFRLPALINCRDVTSDSAVVGLQAMHMLRGESSWFLWGAEYQSSLDSAIAAAVFAVMGPSPLALTLVPVVGYLLALLAALAVLQKRIGPWAAAACALPLIVAPWAMNSPTITAPRQWSITLVFASVWLLDAAAQSRRPMLRFALGVFVAAAAVAVDLYTALFIPPLAALALLCTLDDSAPRHVWRRRMIGCATGAVLGLALLLAFRASAQFTDGKIGLSPERLAPNAKLLWNTCLPFSLGYALYSDSEFPYQRTLRVAPMPWRALQIAGGWSLVAGIAAGAWISLLGRTKIDWPTRRLAAFGVFAALTSIFAFLFSVMPVDMWAVRYLAPIFWTAPFALAAVAAWIGWRRFALLLCPYLVVAAIGGWLSYGLWVDGPLPRRSAAAVADEESQLVEFLRARGIKYGATDYWLAYRLTFVCRENPILVPLDSALDRYEPYREKFLAAATTALIFHPAWSRQPAEPVEEYLRQNGIPYQVHDIRKFRVLIVNRARGQ